MSVLLPEPWHTVHIDFSGPFPSGEYLLMLILASLKLTLFIPQRQHLQFPNYNASLQLMEYLRLSRVTNGPPFASQEFQSYMTEIGVKHQKITPHWPQANSAAENFMKPLTKAVHAAHTEKKKWKKKLYMFLLNYRDTTPHTTTGFPPSELLFNRKIRTKLPQVVNISDKSKDDKVRQADELAKSKMKFNADRT